MANKSHSSLTDKNIKELEVKSKAYYKVVGNPKELHIRVNPNGDKRFFI